MYPWGPPTVRGRSVSATLLFAAPNGTAMEPQTRAYLRGRFGDHYRRSGVSPPPAADEREWGYIPWTSGDTRMVRHHSLLDLGEFGANPERLGEFIARERPRHVYYSAARYDDPGADSMGAKGWRSADLVFDLDADHLPGVDPETDAYAEMLSVCKDALGRLLDLLEGDFGFEDNRIVFPGGRGYHVHVRDDRVLDLGREQRREIVDYVLGEGLEFESLLHTETVAGMGRSTPAEKRSLPTDGGWGARVHRRLLGVLEAALDAADGTEENAAEDGTEAPDAAENGTETPDAADEASEGSPEDGIAVLTAYEGIGEGRAEAALEAARSNYDEIASGNVDVHPAVYGLAKAVAEETVRREHAPIDEPVTTDVNRLIRLPGSLHGGTALAVTPVERDALAGFDPFVDAVPGTFRDQEIAIDVREPGETPFPAPSGGGSFTVRAGEKTVPEYVGAFLMARGRAEKAKE